MFGSHSFGLTGLSQWRTGAGVFRTSCERGVTVSRKRSCIAPPPRHNLSVVTRRQALTHSLPSGPTDKTSVRYCSYHSPGSDAQNQPAPGYADRASPLRNRRAAIWARLADKPLRTRAKQRPFFSCIQESRRAALSGITESRFAAFSDISMYHGLTHVSRHDTRSE